MGLGSAALNTSQKREPGSPGPPFPANSAENGLSVDSVTGRIVLGNNVLGIAGPAQLLNSREISTAGFSIFLLDIPGGSTNELNGQGVIASTPGGDQAQFTLQQIAMITGNNTFTVSVLNNDCNLVINSDVPGGSNPPFITLVNNISPDFHSSLQNGAFHIGYTNVPPGDNKILTANPAGLFEFGDLSNVTNGSKISIDDTTGLVILQTLVNASPAKKVFSANGSTGIYAMGDVDTAAGGTAIRLNDAGAVEVTTMVNAVPGIDVLILDGLNDRYSIGDSVSAGSGTLATLDGAAKQFQINNITNDMSVLIRGVLGFTGTVTPVTSITVLGGIVTSVT